MNYKDVLEYNESNGYFYWLETRSSTCIKGSIAGSVIKNGYRLIGVFGKRYRAHHLVWIIMTGSKVPKGYEIDHINRNRDDNRWSNLRLATRSQNNINSKDRISKLPRGVMLNKGKYTAYIDKQNKRYYLGTYNTIEEAKLIRDNKAIELYGEFAL